MVERESRFTRAGQANFVKGPKIANPQILGLNPRSQIRKVLRRVGPQIAKPQIFTNNSQIPQFFFFDSRTLSENNPKRRIFTRFLVYTNELEHYMPYCREKKF